MKIGTIIKEKRTKSGLTQEDLAKKLHVSRSTISNWEINRNYPDIKLIVDISNILEIPLKELLQEESDIVNRLSEDTIIRKKISKRNKILYFLIFILSVVIYFSNINDISNKKEIVGAYISNEKLYIKTDLPIYKSIGGYLVDINNNAIEVSIFTKLSLKHNEKISIPITELPITKEKLKEIKAITFIYNGHIYKTISLE